MIVTFYSYKGGVGRSMAMANVAYILARQGLKTLIVDFDLEAPGLEQYFQTNHAAARRNPGLVDLLQAYKRSMSVTAPPTGGDADFKQIDRFIVPLYDSLPGGGRLDLLPAGQRESREELDRYASTLRTFDWQDFYFNWEGELFFEWLRGLFVPDRYDVVLVDSRTGVTEMGGICTYQLADAVVMLCAANHQNIRGTRNVITDFLSASVRATRQFRPLQILVVPARIEQRDQALYDTFMTRFETEFRDTWPEALQAQIGYRDLTVPYEPSYAFDERVITDPSVPGQQRTIAGAFVRLARAIALMAPADSKLRAHGAADATAATPAVPGQPGLPQAAEPLAPVQYDVAKRFAGYDVFLAYNHADAETIDAIVRGVRARGLEVFVDRHELASGEDWRARTEQALFHSRLCVIAYGRDGFGAVQTQQLLAAVSSVRSAHDLPMMVASLPGADDGRYWIEAPRGLASGARWIDLRQWTAADARQLDRLAEVWRDPRRAMALPSVPVQEVSSGQDSPRVDADPVDTVPVDIMREDREATASVGSPSTVPPPIASEASTTASYDAPYPGARAFTERDAGFLFSREAETAQVAEALERLPVVIVTGPSGCGKTSLILAAVMPALRQRQAASSGPGWLFERTTPEREPLPDLARAIERLREARAAAGGEVRSVLFVDELEDLLLHPNDEDRRRYLERLGELAAPGAGTASGTASGITLLIAVREDRLPFFRPQPAPSQSASSHSAPSQSAPSQSAPSQSAQSQPDHSRSARPESTPPQSAPPQSAQPQSAKSQAASSQPAAALGKSPGIQPVPPPASLSFAGPHVIVLPRLSSDALSDAIERTAQRAGLAFEPGLVRRLVVDWALDQRFLPFLQSVLYTLWARRREGYLTNRAYDDIPDPVEAAAEAAYADLSPARQPLAARIIPRLLALCGDLAVYDTSCARSDLLLHDMDPREFEVVIERLIEGHLIYAFAGPDGAPRVAPAFSSEQWTRASSWMDEDRAFLDWVVRVDRYRQDWEREARDRDTLLSGSLRSEAHDWATKRAADLTAAEHEYLRLSDEAAARARQGRWLVAAMAVAILLWVGWFRYEGYQQTTQATARAAELQARAAAVEQLMNAGDTAAASGLWKEALSSYSQAIDKVPDHVSARLKRGAIRDQQRDYTGAVADFTAAIDVAAKQPAENRSPLIQAYLARGTASFHAGDAPRALRDLDAAVALDAANPLALFNRAVVHEALKNDQAALRDYTAALAANPDFADALFNRGALYERLSRNPGATGDHRVKAAADFSKVLSAKDAAPQTQEAARTRLEGLGRAVTATQRAPVRVFLHYLNARDSDAVQRVATALRDKNLVVDSVTVAYGTGSDVRYFFLEDETTATTVQQIAQTALAAAGYNVQLPTVYARDRENATPGRIEVWVPSLNLRLLPNKAYPNVRGARSP